MKMFTFYIKNAFAIFVLAFALVAMFGTQSKAYASLLVEQYESNRGVYSLATANALIADDSKKVFEGHYDIIDFTDDRNKRGYLSADYTWPASGDYHKHDQDNNTFAARITGQIYIDASDIYTFMTWNDDGLSLKINGQSVIHDDRLHPTQTFYGQIALDQGIHDLELIFFENGGEAVLELLYARGQHSRHNAQAFSALSGVSNDFFLNNSETTSVPAPGTIMLLLAGGAGLLATKKKK